MVPASFSYLKLQVLWIMLPSLCPSSLGKVVASSSCNLSQPMCQSSQAAIIKHHRLGGSINKNLFLTVLEEGKSKIKVLAN